MMKPWQECDVSEVEYYKISRERLLITYPFIEDQDLRELFLDEQYRRKFRKLRRTPWSLPRQEPGDCWRLDLASRKRSEKITYSSEFLRTLHVPISGGETEPICCICHEPERPGNKFWMFAQVHVKECRKLLDGRELINWKLARLEIARHINPSDDTTKAPVYSAPSYGLIAKNGVPVKQRPTETWYGSTGVARYTNKRGGCGSGYQYESYGEDLPAISPLLISTEDELESRSADEDDAEDQEARDCNDTGVIRERRWTFDVEFNTEWLYRSRKSSSDNSAPRPDRRYSPGQEFVWLFGRKYYVGLISDSPPMQLGPSGIALAAKQYETLKVDMPTLPDVPPHIRWAAQKQVEWLEDLLHHSRSMDHSQDLPAEVNSATIPAVA